MKLVIWQNTYSLQWDGTYHFALESYPMIQDWELEKIAAFCHYERMNHREPQIICKDQVIVTKINQYLKHNNRKPHLLQAIRRLPQPMMFLEKLSMVIGLVIRVRWKRQ